MLSFPVRGSPKAALFFAAGLIALIAFADWRIERPIPLGFLYLFPMLLIGTARSRWPLVVAAAVCTLLTEAFDSLAWSFETLEHLPGPPHAYHLIPREASKAAAVARQMRARDYAPEECIAVGDSREDLDCVSVVGTFWLVANALDDDPTLSEEVRPGGRVRIASAGYGAGVYEAVVSTLAEGR